MDSWKAEVRRVRRDKIRRKKMQMREKVGKSRNTVFFQWFVAPVGRKVGSLKRRVRSQLARWEMKSCTSLWREAHFPSQNVQNTRGADHFWKLRCRKSARRCGAKHISKWKCTKHTILGALLEVEISKKLHAVVARSTFPSQNAQNTLSVGPLLEVEISKKCTPLWREAHFQVKSVQNTWQCRTTFGSSDVEKVSKKCTPLWREAHFEVKSVQSTEGFEPFLTWRSRKSRHWLT